MFEELIEILRELIVHIARWIGIGKHISPTDNKFFADYPKLTLEQRKFAIDQAIQYHKSLSTFSQGAIDATLREAFGLPPSVHGLDKAGPALTSGVLVGVPWEITESGRQPKIKVLTVQATWEDTLDDVRRKAREAIREFLRDTDAKWHILL